MQTARGATETKAGGPTGQEFKDFIRQVQAIWYGQQVLPPVWSWDNARIHGAVAAGAWTDLGITTANHTNLPPYSPDMHNVIETTHAIIMKHMQDFMNQRAPQPTDTLQIYTDQLQAIFKEHITPKYIKSLTHRLFSVTLPAIVEAEGHYPSKTQR